MTINNQNVEAYAGLAVALHRLGQDEQAKEMLACGAEDHREQRRARGAARPARTAGRGRAIGRGGLRRRIAAVVARPADRHGARRTSAKWIEHQIERYEEILDEHPDLERRPRAVRHAAEACRPLPRSRRRLRAGDPAEPRLRRGLGATGHGPTRTRRRRGRDRRRWRSRSRSSPSTPTCTTALA